ncbi:MAG TPA: hypothetical protein VH135_07655 [Steroidobacteraceae bacterium]|nr:hypothetical protein [Steroidobacteraceae bacterium]
MQAEPRLADTSTLKLPAELLADIKRHTRQKADYWVEGWRPSLLERLLGMLGLK